MKQVRFKEKSELMECTILKIIDKRTGKSYDDWRAGLEGKDARICVCTVDIKPEQYVIYFFPAEGNVMDVEEDKIFRTSLAKLSIDDDAEEVVIDTRNSIYRLVDRVE